WREAPGWWVSSAADHLSATLSRPALLDEEGKFLFNNGLDDQALRLSAQRHVDRVKRIFRSGLVAFQAFRGGLAQVAVPTRRCLLGCGARPRTARSLVEREGLLRFGLGFKAARENHRIFDRIGPALSEKRQHRMRGVAE